MRWRTLCALVGLASIAAPVEPAPIEPLGGYLSPNGAPSGGQTLFSPWHVWADEAGAVVQNITAESQEGCAALCWQDPDCTLFDFRSCADEVRRGADLPCLHSPGACSGLLCLAWSMHGVPVTTSTATCSPAGHLGQLRRCALPHLPHVCDGMPSRPAGLGCGA